MKTCICLFGALAFTLLALSSARCQIVTPEQMGLNYSITAGAALPITKNMTNSTAATVGVSWFGAASNEMGANSAFGLSINWIGIKRNDGSNVSLFPLLFNYKASGVIFDSYRIFTVLGVGVFMASKGIDEMDIKGGGSFAWSAGVGIDVTNRLYMQGRFIAGDNPGTDGLALVELGYRL